MKKKGFVKVLTVLFNAAVLLLVIFLIGRYGWKLGGFDACGSAGIERIEVTQGQVEIAGYDPSLSPDGFLGYHAEEEDGKLYVGFKFSALFGIFETGDFEIKIPTEGEIKEVYIKTADFEELIWSAEESAEAGETAGAYDEIIAAYTAAAAEQWKAEKLIAEDMNYLMADSAVRGKIGYTVTDLDGNGTEELLIGTDTEDAFFGKMILVLYTLDENGAPLRLFTSGERDRYYYAGENRFAHSGSSGADDSFDTTVALEGTTLTDLGQPTAQEDYVQILLTPLP